MPRDHELVGLDRRPPHVASADEQRIGLGTEEEAAVRSVDHLGWQQLAAIHVPDHLVGAIAGEDAGAHLPHHLQPVRDLVRRRVEHPLLAQFARLHALGLAIVAGGHPVLVRPERAAHRAHFAHDVSVGHDRCIGDLPLPDVTQDHVGIGQVHERPEEGVRVRGRRGSGLAEPATNRLNGAAKRVHFFLFPRRIEGIPPARETASIQSIWRASGPSS
ncbi:hypothetical protein D3C86_797560 [compost metagenome]